MKKPDWKSTFELIGIAAIVASLIFVGLQLRQESAVATRESSTDFVGTSIELAQMFSDNRDIWIRGLDGEELSTEELFTFNAMVRVFFVDRVNRWSRATLGIDRLGGSPELLARYVAVYLHQYPGLRAAFESIDTKIDLMNKAVNAPTTSEFRTLVSETVREFDANPPELPEKDYIVF